MPDATQPIIPNFTGGRGTPKLEQPGPVDEKAAQLNRLRKSAGDFESLFLAQLLKTMQATVHKTEQSTSLGGDVMLDVATEKLAEDLSKRGGIGLRDMILKSMEHRITDPKTNVPSTQPIPRMGEPQFHALGNTSPQSKKN